MIIQENLRFTNINEWELWSLYRKIGGRFEMFNHISKDLKGYFRCYVPLLNQFFQVSCDIEHSGLTKELKFEAIDAPDLYKVKNRFQHIPSIEEFVMGGFGRKIEICEELHRVHVELHYSNDSRFKESGVNVQDAYIHAYVKMKNYMLNL